MDYRLSQDPSDQQIDVIHGFLQQSYWSPGIRREVTAKALANSMVIGAFTPEGEQVGFVRLVTDRATFAYLCDVFVLEGHRGHGLATRMIRELFEHPELQTLRKWALATWDAQALYAQLGFEPVPEGRWMQLKTPPESWRQI
ncbi:MAG: GNAT family N-acetyltransferase [Planctomycetota bacterium]